jgi:hypothetical protein
MTELLTDKGYEFVKDYFGKNPPTSPVITREFIKECEKFVTTDKKTLFKSLLYNDKHFIEYYNNKEYPSFLYGLRQVYNDFYLIYTTKKKEEREQLQLQHLVSAVDKLTILLAELTDKH